MRLPKKTSVKKIELERVAGSVCNWHDEEREVVEKRKREVVRGAGRVLGAGTLGIKIVLIGGPVLARLPGEESQGRPRIGNCGPGPSQPSKRGPGVAGAPQPAASATNERGPEKAQVVLQNWARRQIESFSAH